MNGFRLIIPIFPQSKDFASNDSARVNCDGRRHPMLYVTLTKLKHGLFEYWVMPDLELAHSLPWLGPCFTRRFFIGRPRAEWVDLCSLGQTSSHASFGCLLAGSYY